MATFKKVYFGSMFGFRAAGVDEFVDKFKNSYSDSDSVPFISFQHESLFSCSIDRADFQTAPNFLVQLDRYVTDISKNLDSQQSDPVEGPRIYPLDSSATNNVYIYDPPPPLKPDHAGLVDYNQDASSASDEEANFQGMQHVTTYWTPDAGDIQILTKECAEVIASSTGCDIYPEPLQNRVRLVNGDFNGALRKIQNLEPLLVKLAPNRNNPSPKANGNILILDKVNANAAVEFVRTSGMSNVRPRIIVGDQVQKHLVNKCVAELREWDGNERVIPENLLLSEHTVTKDIATSNIWRDHVFRSLGDPRNTVPRQPEPKSPRRMLQSSHFSPPPVSSSKYLEPHQVARVTAWTSGIVEEGDPNEIKPETMPEPEPQIEIEMVPTSSTPARRRLVAPDSDDSDQDDDKQNQKEPDTGDHNSEKALPADDTVSKAPQPPEWNSLRNIPTNTSDLIGLNVDPFLADAVDPSYEADLKTIDLFGVQNNLKENLLTQTASVFEYERHAATEISCDTDVQLNSAEADSEWNIPSKSKKARFSKGHVTINKQPQVIADHDVSLRGGDQLCSPSRTDVQHGSLEEDPDLYAGAPDNSMGWDNSENPDWHDCDAVEQPPEPTRNFHQQTKSHNWEKSYNPVDTYNAPENDTFKSHSYRGGNRASRGKPTGRWSRGADDHRRGNYGPKTSHQVSFPRSVDDDRDFTNSRDRGHTPRGRSNRGRGSGRGNDFRSEKPPEQLVYFRKDTSHEPLEPPPGFDVRASEQNDAATTSPQSSTTRNLLDEPIPLIKHQTSGSTPISGLTSSTESKSRTSKTSSEYVNLENPTLNIKHLNQLSVAKLKALKAKKPEQELNKTQQSGSKKGKQRKEDVDELGSRTFHSTMNLRAGNPGKKKKSQGSALTKQQQKERKEQIEREKQEAYGPIKPMPQRQSSSQQEYDVSDMSKKKKQLLAKTGDSSYYDSDIVKKEARQRQVRNLMVELSPIFEAGRAFRGELRFEIQFGQILIPYQHPVTSKTIYDAKAWNALFGEVGKSADIQTSFTNILTTNGADFDRLLEVKALKGKSPKLWNTNPPFPVAVQYLFHCHSKGNDKFIVIIDDHGDYKLCKSSLNVGMVNLHFPGQIWDASAVLHGTEEWMRPPRSISDAVKRFVESIYVLPDRQELCLVFRQPSDNEIAIRSVLVKRISSHHCLEMDCQDFQLQITEVKTLYNKVHPEDKKLWQGFEKDYGTMVQDGNIHYEVSVIHTGINKALLPNQDVELGELTPALSTGKSLLEFQRIMQMFTLADHMLRRMDFVGARNIGSLMRLDYQRELQQSILQRTLAPLGHNTRLGPASLIRPSMVSGPGSSPNRSPSKGEITNTNPRANDYLRGVRMNTIAEVFEDAEGNKYAKGLGGARIPVPNVSGDVSTTPLAPDDSASQFGGPPRTKNQLKAMADKKPAGFW